MNSLCSAVVATLLFAACAVAGIPTTAPATSPTTQPVPLAAIWLDIGYPPPGITEYHRLMVGVWSDGTVIWSDSADHLGKPYLTAKLDPAHVTKLLADLDAAGFFTNDPAILRESSHPPDASHYIIGAATGDKRQQLLSWRNPPQSKNEKFKEIFTKSMELIRAAAPKEGESIQTIDERVYQLGRKPR